MATLYDHDYWDFTAEVYGSSITVGTAVKLVTRTDGSPIPWAEIADADVTTYVDTSRSNYIGVAMSAGAVGENIVCRCWAAGTTPIACTTASDVDAGLDWYWNGTTMTIVDVAKTDYTCTTVTIGSGTVDLTVSPSPTWGVDAYQYHEVLITSDDHINEYYLVTSNTADTLTITTTDASDWTAPFDFSLADSPDYGFSMRTAKNMSKITGNASAQVAEFLVLKGGRE